MRTVRRLARATLHTVYNAPPSSCRREHNRRAIITRRGETLSSAARNTQRGPIRKGRPAASVELIAYVRVSFHAAWNSWRRCAARGARRPPPVGGNARSRPNATERRYTSLSLFLYLSIYGLLQPPPAFRERLHRCRLRHRRPTVSTK